MRRLVLPVAVLMVVAAGTVAVLAFRWPGAGPEPSFADQADQVLDAWRQAATDAGYDSGLRLLDTRLVRPARGFADDRLERKFLDGSYELRTRLPTGTPPPGEVRHGDGATLPVPVVPADVAYAGITGSHGWTCSPGYCLGITEVRLGTTAVRTNAGPATVPAWLFTVTDWSDPVAWAAWVAVAPSALAPVPEPSPPPARAGLLLATPTAVHAAPATAGAGATRLVLTLMVDSCAYTEPQPLVREAPDAIVIGARITESHAKLCPSMPVRPRGFTVTLTAPLGYRVLLDAATGQPVPLGDR
jgi:hypothetical protein